VDRRVSFFLDVPHFIEKHRQHQTLEGLSARNAGVIQRSQHFVAVHFWLGLRG